MEVSTWPAAKASEDEPGRQPGIMVRMTREEAIRVIHSLTQQMLTHRGQPNGPNAGRAEFTTVDGQYISFALDESAAFPPDHLVLLTPDNLPTPLGQMAYHTNESNERCAVSGCDMPTKTGICADCAEGIRNGEPRYIDVLDLEQLNEHQKQ